MYYGTKKMNFTTLVRESSIWMRRMSKNVMNTEFYFLCFIRKDSCSTTKVVNVKFCNNINSL